MQQHFQRNAFGSNHILMAVFHAQEEVALYAFNLTNNNNSSHVSSNVKHLTINQSGLIRTTTTKLSERYDVAELLEMLPGSSGISKQVKQYVMNAFGWSGTDCMFDFELLELGTLNSSKDI